MTTMDYIIGKVKGFHIANMTLAKWKLNYDRVRKEFWQTLGVIVVVVALLLLFGGSESNDDTNTGSTAQTATDTAPDFIELACRQYEERTGRKIYTSGRNFIRNGATREGLTTVNDVLLLIRANEKYMWKDMPPTTVIQGK